MRILILGGGPTGLGAALRLHNLGHTNWKLWEALDKPGGLARSEVDEYGFTWDIGGHVQFSHYKTFDDLMDKALGADGWIEHQRESWIRIFGTWVPYPFQYNIHRLPKQHQLACLKGLMKVLARRDSQPVRNFEQLIRARLGDGLAELFMIPYNTKVWACPPDQLSTQWIGERVAMPEADRIAESILMGEDNVSWGPNNLFRFPKHGGTGAIWRAVANMLPADRVTYGRRAVRIDPSKQIAYAQDGTEAPYDRLISTVPVDQLVQMAGLEGLAQATSLLQYSGVHVVGVGLHGQPGPQVQRKCWMYFPEDNCPFYRVTVFSHYSPNNVSDIGRYWSLMAEVAHSPVRPADPEHVVEQTLDGMIATGLIDRREQVHHVWHRMVPYSYPTPGLRRDEAINDLLPALERMNIYSRGRFGAWKYEVSNQDHSLMQGIEVVNHLLYGSPELTLWYPDIVNATHPVYKKDWL